MMAWQDLLTQPPFLRSLVTLLAMMCFDLLCHAAVACIVHCYRSSGSAAVACCAGILCFALSRYAENLCCAALLGMLCHAVLYLPHCRRYCESSLFTFARHGMLCHVMLCYAMLCYAMLCYAMLCCGLPPVVIYEHCVGACS